MQEEVRGGAMILYDNLWNVIKERGILQYALIRTYHIRPAQITRLKRNESVSTHTIDMFCRILDCEVGDIIQYVKNEKPGGTRCAAGNCCGASF